MSLEIKSKELKELLATYDTQWLLGDLSSLMNAIASGRASDQLGQLSSPLRQIYYLGGLLMTSEDIKDGDCSYSKDKWEKIVLLLNEIEIEYDKLFFPKDGEEINEDWLKIRKVAVPSFLSYFNQGPLNYEEQIISWVQDLYTQFDQIIETETGIKTEKFVQFYNNLDKLVQEKFKGFTTDKDNFQDDWLTLTNLKMGVVDGVPESIKEQMEERRPLYTFMSDKGIINRFKITDLAHSGLTEEEVKSSLSLLSCKRENKDFLYYTSTKPGNPLYDKPIVEVGNDIYQVFEVKQVIHAIANLLESICSKGSKKLVKYKGNLLEEKIVQLLERFFGDDCKIYTSYYVDGCEQDILVLWKEYAFIIEAKGYNLREPFRDPDKAFVRIKDDFKACLGYGHSQTKRVADKFKNQVPLKITDKDGKVIEEIDTSKYEENDFSIIVNLDSFGQIQCDLSTLLELADDDEYPWAVKLDDLEVFILTLIAQNKEPEFLVDFLILRERLHGKLYCSDELEVCGGILSNKITDALVDKVEQNNKRIRTKPGLTNIFDDQYNKGMGFKDEKLLNEKKSGNYIFL